MFDKIYDASHVAVRLAIAFFAVVVVAPPVLIAVCFLPASWTVTALVFLLLMFFLMCACVLKADELESAIIRGLLMSGLVLLVFPATFALSSVLGTYELQLLHGQGIQEAIAVRNLLLVYDLAIGTSCLALGCVILARAQRQAGLDPHLADAELRQAFFEVRQIMEGRA
jgi:hypothetical protein